MGRVLVVDDESMVLDVLETMLSQYGHEVVSTTQSAEALTMIDEPFDLFLFDLRMPDPTGADLAEAVRARHPDATVLVMTGYPGDPLAARALRSGVNALVKKPFEIGKILSYLRNGSPAQSSGTGGVG